MRAFTKDGLVECGTWCGRDAPNCVDIHPPVELNFEENNDDQLRSENMKFVANLIVFVSI